MEIHFVFDRFFCPEMQEEHRPIIHTRDTIQSNMCELAEVLPHVEYEYRRQVTATIESLTNTYRVLDDMHTAYMQQYEKEQAAIPK